MSDSTGDLDIESFHRDGWLVVPAALNADRLADLDAAVDRLARWADNGGPGLHHFEQTDAGAVLARSEDFVHRDAVLRELIHGDVLVDVLRLLFDDEPVLFKEKINYKQPGGGGFAPHQDATAYRFVDHHISCMVPLDPATPASGCLYVARGHRSGRLPTDDRGRIDASTSDTLDWEPVPLEPGDLLFFDSYTPHYSDTNTTDRARRAAYLTYNAAARGDHRDRYYADKRAEFERAGADFDGERVRISISDDFLGRPAEHPTADPAANDTLDDLFALYASPAAQRLYDEAVTEFDHALQAAALAQADGAPPALVAAALLHDVGHLIADDNVGLDEDLTVDAGHEQIGARYLARWFGPEVTAPVALHVAAKRYLCATEASYLDGLSASSLRSLRLQGGPMDRDEAERFERHPQHEAAVLVRRWDDLAKVADRPVDELTDETADVADYRPLLTTLRRV